MKFVIAADIEGVAGVSSPMQGVPGNAEYEQSRRLMCQEINSVASELFAHGAGQVVVVDCHGAFTNILFDELDERVALLSGGPRDGLIPAAVLEDVDSLVLLGFHTASKRYGVMSHTLSGLVFDEIALNGTPAGEIDLLIGQAAESGTRVLCVSGDDQLIKHVTKHYSTIPTVVTKKAHGAWSATSFSSSEVRTRLGKAIRANWEERGKFMLPKPDTGEIHLVWHFTRQNVADAVSLWPGVNRISATSVEITCPS